MDAELTIEALEQLKNAVGNYDKQLQILFSYMKTPEFDDDIKQSIFDIVRKNPPDLSKTKVENLFSLESYPELDTNCDYDSFDIQMIFCNITGCQYLNYCYFDNFWEDYYFDVLFKVIAEANKELIDNKEKYNYEDAYVAVEEDIKIDIQEWYIEKITLDEWKAVFLEIATTP